MQLKLFLNKVLKVDHIEEYTLGALTELRNAYTEFLKTSNGSDPDFPMINFGNNMSGGNTESFNKSNNIKHVDEITDKDNIMNNIPFPENSFKLTK